VILLVVENVGVRVAEMASVAMTTWCCSETAGPGAFVLAVNDLGDFPAAIRRKLVLEVASR